MSNMNNNSTYFSLTSSHSKIRALYSHNFGILKDTLNTNSRSKTLMASLASTFDSSVSQQRWVEQITNYLQKEIKVDIDVPVSIFRVPTTLRDFKPEAYVPRVIGLGPYHHFDPDLYEMQRYKLAATSRLQKEFNCLELDDVVSKLTEFELDIRASYHTYLDIDVYTLIWIMSIDGLFLIDILRDYATSDDDMDLFAPTTALLVDSSGGKMSNDAVISDIMMLENQIPFSFLSKILSTLSKSSEVVSILLPPMLIGFCNAVSPLKLNEEYRLTKVLNNTHLVDLLYRLIVPNSEESSERVEVYEEKEDTVLVEKYEVGTSNSGEVFSSLWSLSSNLNISFISRIAKPINVIAKVPWKRISSLASSLKEENPKDVNLAMLDEITIPSVSDLCSVGVSFRPTNGDVTSIMYDKKCKVFYLPVITLNVNSEVILRNLVAYEASSLSPSLVLGRYTELMNGIIDTGMDAKILRENKIIVSSLKSDAEVAELFNGMSKSVRLTNVSHIDKAIADVNKYYHGTRKVRFHKCMLKYVYGSWKLLTLLASILIMFLMIFQSFCTIYNCPRIIRTGELH